MARFPFPHPNCPFSPQIPLCFSVLSPCCSIFAHFTPFFGRFFYFFSPLPHFPLFLSHFLNVSPLLPICCHVSISIPFYTPEMDTSTQEPKITIENPPKFSKTYRNCPKLAPKFLNVAKTFKENH